MLSVSVDTSKADAAMASVYDALVGQGADASNLVRDETRRLARTIVAFIPPIRGGKATGEAAIDRELKGLITEATPELIDRVGSQYGVRDITQAYVEVKGQPLQLEWDHLDPSGSRLEEYHKQYRDSRTGKVPRAVGNPNAWSARVVVPRGTRAAYIKKVQAHVGTWKSTWALVASRLGQKFPTWISGHFKTVQDTLGVADITGLQNHEKPTVTFGSRAPGNGRMRQRIQAAVNSRAKAMVRRAKLITSGYKQDLAKGMKAQNWVKKTAQGESEASV